MSAVSAQGWMCQRQNKRKALVSAREWERETKRCYTENNVVLAFFECHNYRHGILSFSNDIWILTCFTFQKKILRLCHNGGPVVTAILCWDLVRINADRLQNSWNYSKCIRYCLRVSLEWILFELISIAWTDVTIPIICIVYIDG